MKITELTQKTLSEQITEDRTKLDEIGFVGAGIGAGISYASLAAQYGANPLKWPKAAWAELGADAALGATGLGLAGVAGKTAAKTGAKLAMRKANRATKKADDAVQKANQRPGPTQAKVDASDAKKQADAATKAATDKVAAADAKRGITKGLNPVKAVGYGGLANVGAELATGKPIVSPKDIGLGGGSGPSAKQKGIKKFTQTGGSSSDIPDYVKQGRFIQGK